MLAKLSTSFWSYPRSAEFWPVACYSLVQVTSACWLLTVLIHVQSMADIPGHAYLPQDIRFHGITLFRCPQFGLKLVWKSTNWTPFPECLVTNDKILFCSSCNRLIKYRTFFLITKLWNTCGTCRVIKGHNLMISSEKPVQHYYSEVNLNQHNIHLNKKQKTLYWSPWGWITERQSSCLWKECVAALKSY